MEREERSAICPLISVLFSNVMVISLLRRSEISPRDHIALADLVHAASCNTVAAHLSDGAACLSRIIAGGSLVSGHSQIISSVACISRCDDRICHNVFQTFL